MDFLRFTVTSSKNAQRTQAMQFAMHALRQVTTKKKQSGASYAKFTKISFHKEPIKAKNIGLDLHSFRIHNQSDINKMVIRWPQIRYSSVFWKMRNTGRLIKTTGDGLRGFGDCRKFGRMMPECLTWLVKGFTVEKEASSGLAKPKQHQKLLFSSCFLAFLVGGSSEEEMRRRRGLFGTRQRPLVAPPQPETCDLIIWSITHPRPTQKDTPSQSKRQLVVYEFTDFPAKNGQPDPGNPAAAGRWEESCRESVRSEEKWGSCF